MNYRIGATVECLKSCNCGCTTKGKKYKIIACDDFGFYLKGNFTDVRFSTSNINFKIIASNQLEFDF